MHPDFKDLSFEALIQQLQELETTYAEAFVNGAEKADLSALWKMIRQLRTEVDKRKNNLS